MWYTLYPEPLAYGLTVNAVRKQIGPNLYNPIIDMLQMETVTEVP